MAFPGQAVVRWIMVHGKRIPIFAKSMAQKSIPVAKTIGTGKKIISQAKVHPGGVIKGIGSGVYNTAKGMAGWTIASGMADKIRRELEPGYIPQWWMSEMNEPEIKIGKNKSVKLQKVDPRNPFKSTSQPYRNPKLPPLPTAGQNAKDTNYNQGYNAYKAPVKDSTVYKPKNQLSEQIIKLKKGKIIKLQKQKAGPFIPSMDRHTFADPADETEAFDDNVISYKNIRNIIEDIMGDRLNQYQISKLLEEILNVTREYSADEIDEMPDADFRKLLAQFDFENLKVV